MVTIASAMRILSLLASSALASALPHPDRSIPVHCPIIFDGRISRNATLTTFDTSTSPYNSQYVKGQNLTWSSIILLPNLTASRFDTPSHKPLEVTISDASLFRTSQGVQLGFRRAGLLLKDDVNAVGGDKADEGVVTFHWSVRQDGKRGMNLSHEYMNVWHERADYGENQFTFVGGVVLPVDGGTGEDTKVNRETWKVQNAKNEFIFTTSILWDIWQNFAVRLDYVNRFVCRISFAVAHMIPRLTHRPAQSKSSTPRLGLPSAPSQRHFRTTTPAAGSCNSAWPRSLQEPRR
jgi:hypothetical protein